MEKRSIVELEREIAGIKASPVILPESGHRIEALEAEIGKRVRAAFVAAFGEHPFAA